MHVKRMLLLVLSLLFLIGCNNTLSDLRTVEQQFYKNVSQTPITLTTYANQLEGRLDSPKYDNNTVNSTLNVEGFVKQYHQLTQPYMWIQVTYQGKRTESLPTSLQYYTQINRGKFSQRLKLFAGMGEYEIKVFAPSKKPNKTFYLFTQFRVFNLDPNSESDITYTLQAQKMKLNFTQPLSGYVMRNGFIELNGRVGSPLAKKKLLVQVQKGTKVWQKVMLISGRSTFRETIPLLYGEGVHQIQVMLPDNRKSNFFTSGATFYVKNETKGIRSPVQYSTMYEERGVSLTQPIAGGEQAEYSYPIIGYLDPNRKQAKETTHLIVQTKKDNLVATYFIPIHHFKFNGSVPLRFGAGNYDIILYVPEITVERRDYFRFFMIAKFQVSSNAKEDLRNLLPSRGIEPDNPQIYNLARKITTSADNNYDRVKLIYRYVANVMNYDVNKFNQDSFAWDDSALKSLRLKKGVCQDYVFLTLSLLRSAQIPSRFVEGVANGQNHAWIEAKVNGRWIIMDPTWGSGYIDPRQGFVKHYDGSYFDISAKRLVKTHKRTGVVY
jgi:transglutaminase-like putative cysteine protease